MHKKKQSESTKSTVRNNSSGANISGPNNNNNSTKKKTTQLMKSRKLSAPTVRCVARQSNTQRIANLEPMQHTDHLPGVEDKTELSSKTEHTKQSE